MILKSIRTPVAIIKVTDLNPNLIEPLFFEMLTSIAKESSTITKEINMPNKSPAIATQVVPKIKRVKRI